MKGRGGHQLTVPPNQFQCNLKKFFLWRLVFPMLFGPSDGPPPFGGGGDCKGGGYRGGGGGCCMWLGTQLRWSVWLFFKMHTQRTRVDQARAAAGAWSLINSSLKPRMDAPGVVSPVLS